MNTPLFELLGVLAAAAFVFGIVPRVIFPLERVPGSGLDRVMAGIVAMAAFNTAVMYLLGSVGLLETAPIVVSWAVCWYVLKGRHREGGRVAGLVERGFAYADRRERAGSAAARSPSRRGPAAEPASWLPSGIRTSWQRTWAEQPTGGELVLRIAVVGILLAAAALRFSRAWSHVELVPQDSYLALSWTTFIGQGRLLADGIYPQGTYLCMSLVDRLYPGDVYSAVRFLGPLLNVFGLVALYWAVSRVSRNRAAGLLALAVFGLFAGHPDLLVTWPRQIGAMTNEFAIAFGLVSIVYAARHLTTRDDVDLALAGGALFMAVTSNTLVLPLIGIGYLAVLVAAVLTGAIAPLVRIVVVSVVAALAANYYMLLGFLQGNSFVMSFRLYQPGSEATFNDVGTGELQAGDLLANNELYLVAFLGAVVGVVIGIAGWRRHRLGHGLLVLSLTTAVALLANDLIGPELGLLFRTRMQWMAGALIPVGMGVGVGAVIAAVAGAREQEPVISLVGSAPKVTRGTPRSAVAFAGLLVVFVALAMMWPRQDAIAREAAPSGYPQATDVSLDIIREEERLEFTLVGVSEQYQEALSAGFFVEAWVFARDITMSDAQDPAFELPIPTDRVYLFVEKETFPGPESPPVGPTEEYYRDLDKRERLMQRMLRWAELYRESHGDMSVLYDDPELRVYRIDRNVDVTRANRSRLFKDYRWEPNRLFNTDAAITEDRITSNPRSGVVIEHA